MYRIEATGAFVKSLKKLPRSVQGKAHILIGLLAIDYRDPRLHTKKLRGERVEYSFRVGRDYRGIFSFESGTTILLIDIEHRKDIYR